MTTTHVTEESVPGVEELSAAEGAKIFDKVARRELGVSGSEFLAAWDRGDFAGEPENVEAMSVGMLIPLVR
ncbi:MAG: hypothetical protein ACRDPW_08750 [Mycobacteriales bacterium]